MISDTDLKELQDNEFYSIKAIYPNEVKDLRKNRKSAVKWPPLEIEIKLCSHDADTKVEEDIKAEVELYIKCSETYPLTTPYLEARKPKGISAEDLKTLQLQLQQKCKALIGKEMIMELIIHTQDFLSYHKIPQYGSFFEEMVSNRMKKEQEEAERLEKQKEQLKSLELQKLEAIQLEKQRKMDALKDANKQIRFVDEISSKCNETNVDRVTVGRQRSRSASLGKETCSIGNSLNADCKDMLNSKLKFTGKKELTVSCGNCMGHNERGCITYHGIDTHTGVPVVVIKWILNFGVNHKLKGDEWEALQKEQGYYLKQIASIEQEFKSVRQLNNKYLVHYLGMNYYSRKDKIIISVLQEFVSGCPIEVICQNIHFTTSQLQYYTRQILEALKYLHENSIVHKNIRNSSLFVDNNGFIRLADYSLDKRLYDLYRNLTKDSEIDIYPPTIGKGGKKGDIYRLGVILLSLIDEPPSMSPVKVPEHLNPTFKDFLKKCLIHDEYERWSAEQLLSHPFLAISTLCKEIEINNEKDDDSINHLMLSDEGIHGSRLRNEFDILKILGKGGFGHVWKVKNKLDSRIYALKRIPLNRSNKLLNRKIKREVKLLSRLNHENIVRYYNSWIEGSEEIESSIANDGLEDVDKAVKKESQSKVSSSVQWGIHDKEESSTEDECEDDDDFIVFMSDSKFTDENQPKDVLKEDTSSTVEEISSEKEQAKSHVKQFMYIQMEFCEKSTLRTAIDNGLHKDVSLVWRLFREIVEGLHYIHQQAVIHRDLKPVNIFLDSKDHVKIGDFGLATDVISKSVAVSDILCSDVDPHSKSEIEDGTQTGQVGTTFYVAPELTSVVKMNYTQKVDIYSLGIIFFEMCYPPSVTLMEHTIIISNLRHEEIKLPSDARELLTEEMIQIIAWLLEHDVTKRPSSNELITSKYIPPLLLEEADLNNLLHTTVSNPQSRMFKHMISALFEQEASTEFDFTYDIDAFKGQSSKNKPTQIYSNVVDVLNKIMRLHGAIYFSVPTLMPKHAIVGLENCVQIMDHGGSIVMLPYNLRIPFARYIAHRETDYLKRYSLEKVFRQQKVFGCHPREQYEFAFDIVTPTPNAFLPDAEVISAVSEIILEFSSLECRNYYIRLNHAALLKAIFLFSEVDEKLENKIFELAGKQRHKLVTKSLLTENCSTLQISQRSLSRLSQFLDIEDSIEKIISCLHPLMQKKSRASILAKSSLKELENIMTLTQSLGVKIPILICPALAHNITFFSGMLFQCVCKLKSAKQKDVIDILAVGGRYDKLISSFKLKTLSEMGKSINQSGVGVSIAIESIVTSELQANECQTSGVADFLIHSEDAGMGSDKGSLLKELWDFGVRAMILYDKNLTVNDAVDFCRNFGIPHILVLRKDEPGIIKIRIVEKERYSDKKIIHAELKEHVQRLCTKNTIETNCLKVDCIRSPSFSSNNFIMPSSNPIINVRFLTPDKTHTNRKREQNIRTQVINVLQGTSNRLMELIPLDLKMSVIGTIISHCDISASVDGLQRSFDSIIDENNKHKKYLSQLCEEICDIRAKKSNCSIVLYSLPDNNFKVLL